MKIRLKTRLFIAMSMILTLWVFNFETNAGVGESAVITLIFPPGARATALGEAFTGLADDVSATFYNPAGLGQAPMAHSWKTHQLNSNLIFTAIASKPKKEFGLKDKIWAGTNKGLLQYNGKFWESFERYLIEQDDNLKSIASKYLKSDNEAVIANAVWKIRVENKIGMKHYQNLKNKLKKVLLKQQIATADSIAENLSKQILDIDISARSEAKIYGIISEIIDSTHADTLASELHNVFQIEDLDLSKLQELKIPFSIATTDSITCLLVDGTSRLWVGTANGLWKYNGTEWNVYTILEGLPSNFITSLALDSKGDIAVGTANGIGIYTYGQWKNIDTSIGLPSSYISSLAYDKNGALYIGTSNGMAKIKDTTITIYDTSTGLLAMNIHALFIDSDNRLWIGSDNGITIYNEVSWKRYKFPQSQVRSFGQQGSNIWIGTDKGAISYQAKKAKVDEKGNSVEQPPEWKSYHSKNALTSDNITAISVHDNDVWLTSDKGINQYDYADNQGYASFEQLLPALGLPDLWHLYGAMTFPTQDWGTIGVSLNYVNMGRNQMYDALGRAGDTVRSWEGVLTLSWGLPLKEKFSLGLNAKLVISALAPGMENGEGVGETFAIDAAILKRDLFFRGLDFGFMFQNMGPNISYVNREQADPIPFTLRAGFVYHAIQNPVYDLKFLFDMNKEVVKNHFSEKPDPFIKALHTDLINDTAESFKYEMQEINYNLGAEFWYSNFLAVRTGFLFDYIGERYEWTIGMGIRYAGLSFDFSYIISPEGFMGPILSKVNKEKTGAEGVRQGQWRASMLANF